jgi:SAM-dependent methyltransferase
MIEDQPDERIRPAFLNTEGRCFSAMTHDYVQYGCGLCAPQSWTNFDSSPTLRFERLPFVGRLYTKNAQRFPENVRYGDIIRGLPVSPASCRGVYCSHVLEHLTLEDFDVALKNTYSYLKPGGSFRFVLPDLEQLAAAYLNDKNPDASVRFMQESYLGTKQRKRGLRGLIVYSLGNSAHLWMWDEKSMAKKLAEHGFKDIRRVSFGDAEDPRFNDVEEEGRFTGCLAMQCRR